MTQRDQSFALGGGLDLVTPAMRVGSGRVIGGVNYEPGQQGYGRIDGFERYDGRPAPSAASYWVLNFDAGVTALSADDVITGDTSGATATVLVDGFVESGAYGTSDAAGYAVVVVTSGTFTDGEDLMVSAAKVAELDGALAERGANNDENDQAWLILSIEAARTAIQQVPGSGPIRGVHRFGSDLYAFRDNAGATAGVLHKATTSGWQAQTLGSQISFDTGTAAFVEGETLTGGTSGATATIAREVVESGAFSTNDAAGRLILTGVTGTFQAAETITGASAGSATALGDASAITLPAGGSYKLVNFNFFGSSDLRRSYGVNGVGQGFEWDGTVFVPISTGMTDDRPTRIALHRNHLFFGFRGGSLQHSSIGNPYEWQVITGASELGIGEELTGLLADVAGVLVVFGRSKIALLYGSSSSDWSLTWLADDAGAVAGTVQKIGSPIYLDDRGLRSLATTDKYGNFTVGTISRDIEPLFKQKREAGVSAVGSMRIRAKDQYRLFFDDGSGVTAYFGRERPELLPFDLGVTFTAFGSGDSDEAGNERVYAGDAGGWVYQIDSGTSFDGDPIQAFLRLPFNHVGSPAYRKRFHRVVLEMDSGPDTSLGLTAEYSYADPDQPPSTEQTFTVRGSGGFWDQSRWDEFYWSSPVEGQAEAYLEGVGKNMSLAIISEATYEAPHTLHGLTVYYSQRGLKR